MFGLGYLCDHPSTKTARNENAWGAVVPDDRRTEFMDLTTSRNVLAELAGERYRASHRCRSRAVAPTRAAAREARPEASLSQDRWLVRCPTYPAIWDSRW